MFDQKLHSRVNSSALQRTCDSVTNNVSALNELSDTLQRDNRELLNKVRLLKKFNDDLPKSNIELLGTRLDSLISENRHCKNILESTLSNEARNKAEISEIIQENDTLKHQMLLLMERTKKGVSDSLIPQKCVDFCSPSKIPINSNPILDQSTKISLENYPSGNMQLQCSCTDKLDQIQSIIDDRLGDYEMDVWQNRISTIEAERDDVYLQNSMLRNRLLQLQSSIRKNPFIMGKLWINEQNPHARENYIEELNRRLVLAEESCCDLEKRLEFEKNISRTWQVNLRGLQRELRNHLSDLSNLSRESGLNCSIYRGLSSNFNEIVGSVGGMTRSERESLRLLRQAKNRIEADSKRLAVFAERIQELESEVASLKVENITIKRHLSN